MFCLLPEPSINVFSVHLNLRDLYVKLTLASSYGILHALMSSLRDLAPAYVTLRDLSSAAVVERRLTNQKSRKDFQ